MGIDALGRLIKLSPDIAEQHQLAVIDCMEVSDIFLSARQLALNKMRFTCMQIGPLRL